MPCVFVSFENGESTALLFEKIIMPRSTQCCRYVNKASLQSRQHRQSNAVSAGGTHNFRRNCVMSAQCCNKIERLRFDSFMLP
jgi:hypothetical protein